MGKSKESEVNPARRNLVFAALSVFAEKGYEGATTREICQRAGANISAIRYYFGDKAGLYRAAFTEPMCETPCHTKIEVYINLPLPEALKVFFKEFLEPLKKGEEVRLVMKLHFREMIEPTGVWQEEIQAEIIPQHHAMVRMLMQHFRITDVDADLHRLAFAIIGMAVHFYVGQDVVRTICPELLDNPKAIDTLAERMVNYSLAIIETETKRRLVAA